MRTLIWFIRFWGSLVGLLPSLHKARALEAAGDVPGHDAIVHAGVGRWMRNRITSTGGTVQVLGLENMPAGPAVYVANHLSYFDIPLLMGYLGDDTKPMVAKKEIKSVPLIRSWMVELRCVFIDRDDVRASMAALKEAEAWVAKGYSMVVFPEGTRSHDGAVHEFKSGAFRIAQKNKVPVVPVAISGTDSMMARDSLRVRPGHAVMRVLPPIDTSAYEKKDWRALPAVSEERVRQGVAALRLEDGRSRG
jgi:1-acyl-sn-glycerol-3-phosphate acyltransferase